MSREFGKTKDGQMTHLYEITNGKQMKVSVSDYGAAIVSIFVPDRKGKPVDVVLGYDQVTGYEEGTCFFGAAVGRVANRIGGAAFMLNDRAYTLEQNDNGNNLHSGPDFSNQRIWQVKNHGADKITFLWHSPDKDQGYPGEVDIEVTYTVTEENALSIRYYAVPAEDTLLNMTNHSYFNLAGHGSGDVLNQEVTIHADAFTRANEESIPTGEIVPVKGTPMDFTTAKTIGQDIEADYEALVFGKGYDHNWVLNGSGMRKVASMYAKETGITMEVYTDLPGMQFYTANFVEHELGKEGIVYKIRNGACFETQYFPDAINKDNFVKPVTKAGEEYCTETVYKFI